LANQQANQWHTTRITVDLDAVASRLETFASIGLCPRCEQMVSPVTADTADLLIEVIRLHEAAQAARLESANRLAAIRAALHADRDGESDPLAYLRDELPGGQAPGMARGQR
jgi:uncharacterized protein YggE